MNIIDSYFSELDKEIHKPLRVILTGAVAGALLGSVRPSMDIDFEIQTDEDIEAAISAVSRRLSLPAQYSESIQGWSQISFLDYRETALSYKKIGKIEVRSLSPEHWTIGKMSRYLPLDRMDIASVLKKKAVSWEKIIAVWGRALKDSMLSDKSGEFRDHVADFLRHEGKKIWVESYDREKAVAFFYKKAGIKS